MFEDNEFIGAVDNHVYKVFLLGDDGVVYDSCGFVEDEAQLALTWLLIFEGPSGDKFDELEVVWAEDSDLPHV